MKDKNLCYTCVRGKICRENPAYPCTECPGYVPEQTWISVEDRLPEMNVNVLGCVLDTGDSISVRECYMANMCDGEAIFFVPALGWVYSISHWMPLPEPPKKAKESPCEEAKTMMQLFYETFPKAMKDDWGTPRLCPGVVGFAENKDCQMFYGKECYECWSRPVEWEE